MNKKLQNFIIKQADKLGIATKSFISSVWTSYSSETSHQAEYSREECLDVFASEIWVYTCVDLICQSIASLPIKIFKPVTKNGKTQYQYVDKHELLTLLKNPNPYFKLDEFVYAVQANRDLTGDAYILIEGLKAGKPTELYNLNSSKVEIQVDRLTNKPIGYIYKVDNIEKHYTMEEVIHIRYVDPRKTTYGLSPLSAARTTINILNEARTTNLAMFKNSGRLDGYYSAEGTLNETSFNRLKTEIEGKFRGSKNSHSTPLLEGGVKYNPFAALPKDLEYISGMKLNKEEICSAYKVPVILVNSMEASSYNNIKEATKIFFNQAIIPRLTGLENAFQQILDLYSKDLFIEFDLSNIPALQDDLKDKALSYQIFISNGIPPNQAIKYLELPFDPIENGDSSYMPFSLTEIGASKPQIQPPQKQQSKSMPHLKKITWTTEKKEAKWKAFVGIVTKTENQYKSSLAVYFRNQRDEVVDNLMKHKGLFLEPTKQGTFVLCATDGSLNKKVIDIETVLFEDAVEIKRLTKTSLPHHLSALAATGQQEFDLLSIGVSFDIQDPAIKNWLTKFGLDKANTVIDTAKEGLKQALIEGLNQGESIPELRDRLYDYYNEYEDIEGYKLSRIARTETVAASNQGAFEAYGQAGVSKKSWLAAFDERTRETHIEADNKYKDGIPIDEDFEVGAGHCSAPAQTGLPEEDINCRCTLIPIVEQGDIPEQE